MYRELESRFTAIGDTRNALYAHISRLRGDLGHSNLQQLSLSLAEQLKRPEVQNDPYLKIRCLETKAAADLNLDGVSARPAFEELERTAAQIGEKQIAARASGDLGIVAFLEGNSSEAKWRVGRAIASSIVRHDVAAQTRYLSLFGLAALEHHQPEQALWFLNKGIATAEKNANVVPFPEMAYIGKVGALTQLSRFHEAQECINRAMDYATRSNSAGYQADLFVETGKFYVKQNRIPEAIQALENAIKLSTSISFNRGVAEANAELAALYQRTGNLRKARDCAARCVTAHQQLGEVYLIPHQLAIQAEIETAAGDFAEAEQTYTKAEDLIKVILSHEPSSGTKKGLIDAMSETFLAHFQLAAEHEKDIPRAYKIIEEARGRTIADRLSDGRPKVAPKKTASEVDAERRLELLQIRLLDSNNTQQRDELSDTLPGIETNLPDSDQPQPTAPVPLRRLQSRLKPDELLLEYVLGPKKSYCLSVTRDNTALSALPDSVAIDGLVAQFTQEIRAKRSGAQPAQSLFRALVMPIDEYRRKERLIIVPDGSLNRIPFSALRNERGEFLIRSHDISYVPSGTVLTLMRESDLNVASSLLAVGDVTYGRLNWMPSGWFRNIFRGVSELRRDSLPPLPSTEDEIQSIRSTMGGNPVVLSEDAATETAFKKQAARSFGIIHLAVHAVADQIYPD
ncbi:MAG: CHAT domain-containing protein, partial [Acidobacteriaceae bacterium]|nr:CHAT domain-containing protein [Acidobacteriaceae bacterium]